MTQPAESMPAGLGPGPQPVRTCGSFRCAPIVCEECGRQAFAIAKERHPDSWGSLADDLPEPVGPCVKEFLRWTYRRAKVAERWKIELERRKRLAREAAEAARRKNRGG